MEFKTVMKVCCCSLFHLPSSTSMTQHNVAVFNFWEPLHYLWKGYGFQTWETSPEYSIRSWAYILLHYFPVQVSATFIGPEKVGSASRLRSK